MNRHTILGDKVVGYEWLIQEFAAVADSGQRQSVQQGVTQVRLMPVGAPRTLKLSTIPYETLMRNAYVWSPREAVLDVATSWLGRMCLDVL